MSLSRVLESLTLITPELAMTGFLIVVILADLSKGMRRWVPWFALAGCAGAIAALVVLDRGRYWLPGEAFLGSIAIDRFAFFWRGLFAGVAALAVLFSKPVVDRWERGQGEFYALLLSTAVGMMFMSCANDLLMMYLSLEFVSVTSYILAGFLPKNRKSAEASLKYIIYGAAASGLMIYGMSYLYGITGTLNIHEIGARISELNQSAATRVPTTMMLIVSVLIMGGFGYKVAAVPFHMWCPDVYEGAPTPVTAFFSVGPKAAGFAMLVRFLHATLPPGGDFEWKIVLAILAVLTMAVGNFAALLQQNLKRLLAYSSIAHSGYMLLAFTVFTASNIASVMFYVAVYVLMNLGAFVIVIVMEEKYGIETVDDCRGFGWRSPALGSLMALFLFSLTGLPPTAGFAGKLLIFAEMIRSGGRLGLGLVCVAVFFTVISLYYYARIIAAMFLGKSREGQAEVPAGKTMMGVLWLLGFGTLWFGIFWGSLQSVTQACAEGIITR